MAKGEISWNIKSESGERRQVYAKKLGNRWMFYHRQRRYDEWQTITHPSLEDFESLLDGVKRRVQRRLLDPKEIHRLRQTIKEAFPDSDPK